MGNFMSNSNSQEPEVNFQDINITDALMLKNASINNERNKILKRFDFYIETIIKYLYHTIKNGDFVKLDNGEISVDSRNYSVGSLKLIAKILESPEFDPKRWNDRYSHDVEFENINNYVMQKLNERVSSKMEIKSVNLRQYYDDTYQMKIIAKFKTLLD